MSDAFPTFAKMVAKTVQDILKEGNAGVAGLVLLCSAPVWASRSS